MVQQFTEKSFHTGTININYAEGPLNGPALVMLHGGSARWQLYSEMLAELAERFHIYAPDLRGHGKSDWVPWGYTVRNYVEDIGAFLHQVSGPAVLMGHSLGGIIAVATAEVYPSLVRALIVGDAPLDAATWDKLLRDGSGKLAVWRALAGGTRTVEEIERLLGDAPEGSATLREVFGEGSPIVHELAERLFLHDPDMLGMLIEDYENVAAGYGMETVLPSIRCPVLLLQADPSAGGAMTDAEAARAVTLLKHGRLVKFTGLGHVLFWEDQKRVITEIMKFLEPFSPPKQEDSMPQRSG